MFYYRKLLFSLFDSFFMDVDVVIGGVEFRVLYKFFRNFWVEFFVCFKILVLKYKIVL